MKPIHHIPPLVQAALAERDAPRVITSDRLLLIARQVDAELSRNHFFEVLRVLAAEGAVRRVSRGLFLNKRIRPLVALEEAAASVRSGAVVSLQSVLGQVGFLNNPSATVTAVVSQSAARVTKVGSVTTAEGVRFRFHGIPPNLMPDVIGGLDTAFSYPRATPARALCDHVYLGVSAHSGLPLPPIDVDPSEVDLAEAYKIARRMGVHRELMAFLAHAEALNYGEEPEPEGQPEPEPPRRRGSRP